MSKQHKKLKQVTHTVRHHGHSFKLTGLGADTQTSEWQQGRFYEARLLHEIERMQVSGVYVDVGANFGNHSVFFSRFCPSSLVISVEPFSEALSVLTINLKRHVKKSKLIRKLISDRTGKASMFKTSDSPGSARVKEYDTGDVDVDMLDNVLKDVKDIKLIKLDVEGAGVAALHGATCVLSKSKPVVVAECFRTHEFRDIDAVLSKFGYTTDGRNWCKSRTCIWLPT